MADGRLIAVGGSNRQQGQVRTLEIVSLDAKPAAPEAAKIPEVKTSALTPAEAAR
jgi:hypothetical protein